MEVMTGGRRRNSYIELTLKKTVREHPKLSFSIFVEKNADNSCSLMKKIVTL